jgi:hypothetical protein
MSKSRIAALAALALASVALDCPISLAAPPDGPQGVGTPARHLGAGAFAQEGAPIRRPRARIIVRPRAAPATGIYPSPTPYAYPGPNAVRDCDSRLVQEYRPSGTVIVPRMWCWWTRQ